MILTPAQKTIANDLHRFRVVNCGRRFGKTTLAVLEMVGKAVFKKDRKIAYIAPTYQQARDIAWQELKKVSLPAVKDINESRLEITLKTKDGGLSSKYLRGWESIETLRGQKFDFIVIDEVASMRNFWINWQEVLRPTLTDTRGEALFISTPKGFNHFYDLYNLQDTDPDYKSFHFTSYDNPFIPVDELEKAKKELTEDRFAQEFLADFRKMEGLVYKEFNRDKHTYNDSYIFHSFEKIAGVDFGFTNPAAILTIKIDGEKNYYIDDEWYITGKTESQIAEYVASQGFNGVYADPEAPSAIEELRRRGANIRDVVKNKDSIKSGIQKVRELFLSGRLKVNKKCVNTIYELETYCYPDKKEIRDPEIPIKENDHAMDAMRYALSMRESSSGITSVQNRTHYQNIGNPHFKYKVE